MGPTLSVLEVPAVDEPDLLTLQQVADRLQVSRWTVYQLVWAGPISVLAQSLAVSNVTLAKACRRGEIPLPPRGYWAKLKAGKRVTRPPLPLRAPGASDRIDVGSGRPQMYRADDVDGAADDRALAVAALAAAPRRRAHGVVPAPRPAM